MIFMIFDNNKNDIITNNGKDNDNAGDNENDTHKICVSIVVTTALIRWRIALKSCRLWGSATVKKQDPSQIAASVTLIKVIWCCIFLFNKMYFSQELRLCCYHICALQQLKCTFCYFNLILNIIFSVVVWDVSYTIFCHTMHIHSGKTGIFFHY